MTYQETIDYLMLKLPMFSRQGQAALKPSLDNITTLCNVLGNPQTKYPIVHIAGTNGKGSTSHIIAAALQKAGYKTGLYTSPHLVDLRERIRINGEMISEAFVVDFVQKQNALALQINPSYFELTVAMAFQAFEAEAVDIAVIETGLGGRWDSTNIVTPVLSIITNIGYDHTHILGNTLAEIASEKAGIIKENVPVVIGESHPETEQVFFLKAIKEQTSVIYADSIWEIVKSGQQMTGQNLKAINKAERTIHNFSTDLMGNFQLNNIKTALTACSLLEQAGWKLPLHLVLDSLKNVKERTGLRGRWEMVQQQPTVILDVAHNPNGLEYLQQNILTHNTTDDQKQLHIVCGFVQDKDVAQALKLFPKEAQYYFTQANIPRALPVDSLQKIAMEQNLTGQAYTNVQEAVQAALMSASANDIVLITGSFFIVGEAIETLEKQKA